MILSFIVGIAEGVALALIIVWYARHRDERDEHEQPSKSRLNTQEDKERAEVDARRRRQFDNLMKYTGEKQKA